MVTKKQRRFMDAVAEAARVTGLARPRGRPVPKNLTDEGRRLGLIAARAAPRCQARRRDGQPCRAPALKGARRCLKHGGRVEVPAHPHNVRRFLSGEMHRALLLHRRYLRNRKLISSLSRDDLRSIRDALPAWARYDDRVLAEAAEVYLIGQFRPWRRFIQELMRQG
ncbi:MAG: HGGxSTG domain-containing protein [Paracoccaceae bacterium]